ncbi:MAG: TetR/AcrR family transcriptional regulator [Paramuribaculum sp.]|nr:TetR/AcrR family transcriptional regulator [Paramuribaculum sp.]
MIDKSATGVNDTEMRILSAAEAEFTNKGFAGARTTTIAEAAGVTHAMLHYYFRTKEKLFERIVSEKAGALKEIVLMSMQDIDLPFEEFLKKLISSHLDFVSSNPELPRLLISEVYTNSKRSKFFIEQVNNMAPVLIAGLQKKIDEAVAQGRCRPTDARTLMLDIVSLNIFPFIVTPVIKQAFGDYMNDSTEFIERRKADNFNAVMAMLRP